ncbi:MAG TPA: phosphodiester glycosidase family protein [Acidimicrobiia bacterium]|nr:phosphodiester glycosidase family protein [Acidimicrobiia bacterium]
MLLLFAIPAWSLGRVLLQNSTDPLGARVAEWARNHHMGLVVGYLENVWYSHHQPPVGGTPKGGIPIAPDRASPSHRTIAHAASFIRPPNIRPFVSNPLPREGVWQASGRTVQGRPVLWVTYLRPDPVHTSVVVGVARFDMSHLRASLHAGTSVPGGGPWKNGSSIARANYPDAIAAFNSAFRLDNSRGGYYAEQRSVRPLIPGRASLVIYTDGRADVGLWGRDDVMASNVAAVRQNLQLIVDHGALVPNLANANNGSWGGTVGNRIYVWRSGVGVDAHGNIIYAAGPGLNVMTLAAVLQRAGAVRAMELDINTSWVSLTIFNRTAKGGLQGSNLLASMVRSPNRYLTSGTRDFIEMDARTRVVY